MEYVKYNTDRVWLYQYNGRHNFYGDYYYAMYRSGTKMYYRLKTILTFAVADGYGAYYDNPINAQFIINSKDAGERGLKPNTSGNIYYGEHVWEAESDWIDLEKTTGTVPATVKIYDTANSSWVNHTYYITLPIVPAASELGFVSNFDLEKGFSVPVTKYSSSFIDKLEIKYGNILIKTVLDYKDGVVINLGASEILKAYKELGSGNSGNFTFKLTTYDGDTVVDTSIRNAIGKANGTTKVKVNGVWRNAVPCVKVNGTWKKAVAFTKVNGVWKRGNP